MTDQSRNLSDAERIEAAGAVQREAARRLSAHGSTLATADADVLPSLELYASFESSDR